MAFDHPLEADSVDDLNLFSAFIKAPVVGIMWITHNFIGGDASKKREEEEKLKKDLVGDTTSDGLPPSQTENGRISFIPSSGLSSYGGNGSSLKKMPPCLVGSDISSFGDCAVEDNMALQRAASNDSECVPTLKRSKKKMSWSDESGNSLVEFIEENKMLDPPHQSSTSKPVKSAMKRSKTNSSKLERTNNERSNLVPKGFGGGPNGLVMPTKPFGDSSSNGHVSPEWGWYINTTPPTPEMYHTSRSPKKSGKDPATLTQQQGASQKHPENPPQLTPLSNPAFGRSKMAAVGWPSVPL